MESEPGFSTREVIQHQERIQILQLKSEDQIETNKNQYIFEENEIN